jgi:hypothetical protein
MSSFFGKSASSQLCPDRLDEIDVPVDDFDVQFQFHYLGFDDGACVKYSGDDFVRAIVLKEMNLVL